MSAFLERVWYSGEPESAWRKIALAPLDALGGVYGAAVRTRGFLYDRGLLTAARVEGLRIISVGNVNVGGTGKTPAVIYLANALLELRKRTAVLSRGYGRESGGDQEISTDARAEEVGDEPLLIARRCPGATVLVGRDRAALARRARADHNAQVALLDDGLQHRRLHRDVDVVVVDGDARFGNGRLLPRGPLREPLAALSRASLVWLRVGQRLDVPPEVLDRPHVVVRQRVEGLVDPAGNVQPAERLKGSRVLAMAGIARPGRFLETLEALGVVVVESSFFDDHHRFTPAELSAAAARAKAEEAVIITTEKDAVRIGPLTPVWQVRWTTDVISGHDHLRRLLAEV